MLGCDHDLPKRFDVVKTILMSKPGELSINTPSPQLSQAVQDCFCGLTCGETTLLGSKGSSCFEAPAFCRARPKDSNKCPDFVETNSLLALS